MSFTYGKNTAIQHRTLFKHVLTNQARTRLYQLFIQRQNEFLIYDCNTHLLTSLFAIFYHIMLEYIESIITADQVKISSLVNKTI